MHARCFPLTAMLRCTMVEQAHTLCLSMGARRVASLLCAGASCGGPTLQQRQDRALEHSGRLHTCYKQLLAAGGADA
jgi:hypothetical protein